MHISSKMIRKVLSYTSRLGSWVVAISLSELVLNRNVVELFGAVVARLFPPSMTVLSPGDQGAINVLISLVEMIYF